jgi:hypothetical protein
MGDGDIVHYLGIMFGVDLSLSNVWEWCLQKLQKIIKQVVQRSSICIKVNGSWQRYAKFTYLLCLLLGPFYFYFFLFGEIVMGFPLV